MATFPEWFGSRISKPIALLTQFSQNTDGDGTHISTTSFELDGELHVTSDQTRFRFDINGNMYLTDGASQTYTIQSKDGTNYAGVGSYRGFWAAFLNQQNQKVLTPGTVEAQSYVLDDSTEISVTNQSFILNNFVSKIVYDSGPVIDLTNGGVIDG